MRILENKYAVITGANRGIGKAIMVEFAKCGANIYACARKKDERFEKELSELSKAHSVEMIPVYFDLSDSKQIKEGYRIIRDRKTNIDILVNCAGIYNASLFQMTKMETVRAVFAVNVFSVMEFTQYCIKSMIKQKNGNIINIASISGMDAKSGNCTYGSSKAAVIEFSKSLASELSPFGIRVNAVAPGPTQTEMMKDLYNKMGDSLFDQAALHRWAKAEEIANVVAFLASDKASFVNGQVIRVDGGSQ